jgi:hypothetical protein
MEWQAFGKSAEGNTMLKVRMVRKCGEGMTSRNNDISANKVFAL